MGGSPAQAPDGLCLVARCAPYPPDLGCPKNAINPFDFLSRIEGPTTEAELVTGFSDTRAALGSTRSPTGRALLWMAGW
jgi:hypothetical protein